ncbi:MAG: hypothetical protein ABI779_00225 [Acidobacteriota bacterium]
MKEPAISRFRLHQAPVVAHQRDESGEVVLQATVPIDAQAILRLVKGAGPRVRVAFKEGTQAQWLHDLVAPCSRAERRHHDRSESLPKAKRAA